uniref:Putative secreted protein n=1 Tax=Ixodes ricinus TaxID=34613 RepID=A0A6B0TUJ3_IXORI
MILGPRRKVSVLFSLSVGMVTFGMRVNVARHFQNAQAQIEQHCKENDVKRFLLRPHRDYGLYRFVEHGFNGI